MPDHTHELDATGLNCPLPILRAKKTLKDMASGDILKIISTDPGSVKDFESFAKQTGHQLLSSNTEDDSYIFHLQHK